MKKILLLCFLVIFISCTNEKNKIEETTVSTEVSENTEKNPYEIKINLPISDLSKGEFVAVKDDSFYCEEKSNKIKILENIILTPYDRCSKPKIEKNEKEQKYIFNKIDKILFYPINRQERYKIFHEDWNLEYDDLYNNKLIVDVKNNKIWLEQYVNLSVNPSNPEYSLLDKTFENIKMYKYELKCNKNKCLFSKENSCRFKFPDIAKKNNPIYDGNINSYIDSILILALSGNQEAIDLFLDNSLYSSYFFKTPDSKISPYSYVNHYLPILALSGNKQAIDLILGNSLFQQSDTGFEYYFDGTAGLVFGRRKDFLKDYTNNCLKK